MGPHDTPRIQRAVVRLRDETALPLTFGGPVDADRRLRLTEFAGRHRNAMRGVSLDFGLGLGGKVVARRRPMVLNDYVRSAGISHDYDHFIRTEALRAMVAVPVVVRRTVRGVLYGAIHDAVPIGDRTVQSMLDTARDLEQDLALHDHLARRLDRLDEHAAAGTHVHTTPQWEVVRETYTELRVLLHHITDLDLRRRIAIACDKLTAAAAPGASPPTAPTLSIREVDVLACVALGWTNAQVAADLGISAETVKSYLRTTLRKLRSHSRHEAVVTARRHGLLP